MKKLNIAIIGLGNIGSYLYKYLEKNKVDNVNFLSHDTVPTEKYDLIISNYAFSECTKSMQDFYLENYFNELLKRLETNSDVDETVVELDKKRYLKMFKQNQDRNIAGRTLNEILLRFDNKIKDPRRQIKGQNVVKIIRDYLKISCPMSKAAATLNTFFKQETEIKSILVLERIIFQ